jgi:uncharacterized membrane protein YhfC
MPKPLIYIAAGFLLIGVFPLPYGYYMLLRFIACGVFAWAAYIAFERNEDILPWVFIVLAIIFNPILKQQIMQQNPSANPKHPLHQKMHQ